MTAHYCPHDLPGTPCLLCMPLRDLYAAAFIDGLHRKAERPQEAPTAPVRLDDTDRPPFVPLRGARG